MTAKKNPVKRAKKTNKQISSTKTNKQKTKPLKQQLQVKQQRQVKQEEQNKKQTKSTKLNSKEESFSIGVFFKYVPRLMGQETIALHAAAITFFALFSLVPLLLITYIAFDFFSQGVATEFLFTSQATVGSNATNLFIHLSEQLRHVSDHLFVYILGILIVLYASSKFMYFLQKSLNHIWKVPPPKKWLFVEIRHRAISVLSIFILGFIVMIIVLQKVAFITLKNFLGSTLSFLLFYSSMALALYSIFAIVYKVIPDVKLEWSDVMLGSIFTTLSFWVGNFVIALIISNSLLNSIYGAISGLLLILIWIYYFTQIVYIGAEITKVYAVYFGSQKDKKTELLDN